MDVTPLDSGVMRAAQRVVVMRCENSLDERRTLLDMLGLLKRIDE